MKKTTFRCLTLRGEVSGGIAVREGRVFFSPRWGMVRHSPGLLAATTAGDDSVQTVHALKTSTGIVIAPCEGEPERELVLVQQYSPGVGAKKSPSFKVEFSEGVTVLAEESTGGGSGYEAWSLVSAPLGWAANISAQWMSPLHTGGPVKFGELRTSDLPSELLGAFRGDEQKVREFMGRVEKLPPVDDHIVDVCGRAALRGHLVHLSGDAEFFLGADPNTVRSYVQSVCDYESGRTPARRAQPEPKKVEPAHEPVRATSVAQGGEAANAADLAALREKFRR